MTLLLAGAMLAGPAWADGEDPTVRIYLPRQVAVDTPSITLGQIAVIHAYGGEELGERAGEVALGRAPLPGEDLALDRATILARLVCEGVDATDIDLSGAHRVTVRLDARAVGPDRIAAVAAEALPAEPNAPSDGASAATQWAPTGHVEPMHLPRTGKLLLQGQAVPGGAGNRRVVLVTAHVDGQPVERREVVFQRSYRVVRAVATRDILSGESISRLNATLKEFTLHRNEPSLTQLPAGVVARRKIPAGTVLTDSLLTAPLAEAVVRRNHGVMMRIEGDGFVIQASGQALDDGRVGDVIKIRNTDTFRIIQAKVMPDGTVRPMVEE